MKQDNTTSDPGLEQRSIGNADFQNQPTLRGYNLSRWQTDNATVLENYGMWLRLENPLVFLYMGEKTQFSERVNLPIETVAKKFDDAVFDYLREHSLRANKTQSPDQISSELIKKVISATVYSKSFYDRHVGYWKLPR